MAVSYNEWSEEINELKNDELRYPPDSESDYVSYIGKDLFNWLVEQAEQLHGTKGKNGYKAMYGICNVDYANLNSKNIDLKEQIKYLEGKLSTVLESYKIAFSQNEHHRKLAEGYKSILDFYSNEKNYDRPYDAEDYFDYLPSVMDFDKVKYGANESKLELTDEEFKGFLKLLKADEDIAWLMHKMSAYGISFTDALISYITFQ